MKNWKLLTVRVIDKVKFSKYVTEFKLPVSGETEEKKSVEKKNAVDTEGKK